MRRGLAGQRIHSYDPGASNGLKLYGLESQLQYATHHPAEAAPVGVELAGPGTDKIKIYHSLNGSIIRMDRVGVANDLDFIAQLTWLYDAPPAGDPLHDPHSVEIRALVTYFKANLEDILRRHPDWVFIELKGGWHLDPETGERKGIKFNLDEVRTGWRDVPTALGIRRYTLEQVFAMDGRLKVDFSMPGMLPSPIQGAPIEASVIYRIASKVRSNQVRLRAELDPEEHPESLDIKPARITTFTTEKEDMDEMLDAGMLADSTGPANFHQQMLAKFAKEERPNPYKVLKRLFALLQFWEQPAGMEWVVGVHRTQKEWSDTLERIIRIPALMELGQLEAQGLNIQNALAHGQKFSDHADIWWPAEVRARFGFKSRSLEGVLAEIDDRLTKLAGEELKKWPEVEAYVNWLLERVPFLQGKLSKGTTFLTLVPPPEAKAELAERMKTWRAKYPALKFIHPDDLHITIHFLGFMTEDGMRGALADARAHSPAWELRDGGFAAMGRSGEILGVRYNNVAPEVHEGVERIKVRSSRYGAKPAIQFYSFAPHISFAEIDVRDRRSVDQANRFLRDEMAGALEVISPTRLEVWESPSRWTPRVEPGSAPVYRKYKLD